MNTTAVRRVGAATLVTAALSFVSYPALRPYSDETTLAGAEAMSSGAWVASHLLGMLGFVALTLAAWSLTRMPTVAAARSASVAAALTWLGTSLVLPYYGAETFGLQVIAARAAADGDAGLLALAEAFRYGTVAVTVFGIGLLLLAAGGVALAVALWNGRSSAGVGGVAAAAGGIAVGVALVLYLPQFFLPPWLRVGHGALLALGCLAVAVAVLGSGSRFRPSVSAGPGDRVLDAGQMATGPAPVEPAAER